MSGGVWASFGLTDICHQVRSLVNPS